MAEEKNTKTKEEEKPVKETAEKKPQESKETKKTQKTEEIKTKNTEKKKTEEKKEKNSAQSTKEKPKKNIVKVNARSLPISTKYGVALCNFVRGKKISRALEELEKIGLKKIPLPMKGEIAHKKGKGISSGKYPIKASKIFAQKVKELGANSMNNGLEEPIIKAAIANMAQRPFGQFGRVKRKRTHIYLVACEPIKKMTKKK